MRVTKVSVVHKTCNKTLQEARHTAASKSRLSTHFEDPPNAIRKHLPSA